MRAQQEVVEEGGSDEFVELEKKSSVSVTRT